MKLRWHETELKRNWPYITIDWWQVDSNIHCQGVLLFHSLPRDASNEKTIKTSKQENEVGNVKEPPWKHTLKAYHLHKRWVICFQKLLSVSIFYILWYCLRIWGILSEGPLQKRTWCLCGWAMNRKIFVGWKASCSPDWLVKKASISS